VTRDRLFLGVAAAVFVLDVVLAAPGVTWFDGGEFVAGVGPMGVTHPPGQPAYMVLAKLASLVPVGSLAFRLSMLSSACAAVAAGVLAALVSRTAGHLGAAGEESPTAGAVAGLLIGVSPALTLQSGRPELYSLALMLGLLGALAVQSGGRRGLALAVVPLAVAGAVHHAMLAAAVPGFVLLALGRGRGSLRAALVATAALLPAGLLQFLWLPLRSMTRPELDAGVPRTLERVLMAATGASYARSYRLEDDQLVRNLVEHAQVFAADLGWVGLALAAVGLARLLWAGRLVHVLIGAVFFVAGLAPTALQGVFFPDNPDAHGYLLGPMCVVAAAAGLGARAVVSVVPRSSGPSRRGGALAVAVLLALCAGALAAPLLRTLRVADRSHLVSPQRIAAEVLHEATPGALVLLGGDSWLMPALAARIWERRRPDVLVVGLHMLDGLALPDLATRSPAIPASWTPAEQAAMETALPGLQHERTLRALLAHSPPVDVFVNDFFVAPELLALREPHGVLLRLHRAPGSAPAPDAAASERRLDRALFEPLRAGPGWGRDGPGRDALVRRDLARAGLYLSRGEGDLALEVLQRGSRTARNPWDFVHLARHRLESGADVPGPWATDTDAQRAAALLVDGDLDGARAAVDRVLATQPTHPVALLTAERLYTLGHHVSTDVEAP
jgi:hypothetical protein